MAIDASNIWQLTDALSSKPDNKTNTRLATVSRIDDEGHVWVSIPGGETETPTETTDVEVARGDTVTVEWRNNKLYVLGNSTQPATSSRNVATMLQPIEETANGAAAGVGKAVDAAAAAKQAAQEAAEIAEAVDQHFWYDGNGAHITDATQDAWLEEYAKPDHGELDNPTDAHPWYNQLLGSAGTLLRSGLKNLAAWTRSAIAFYDGVGNAAENIVAQFGNNLGRIGKASGTHVDILSDGMLLESENGRAITMYFLEGSGGFYTELSLGDLVLKNDDTANLAAISSTSGNLYINSDKDVIIQPDKDVRIRPSGAVWVEPTGNIELSPGGIVSSDKNISIFKYDGNTWFTAAHTGAMVNFGVGSSGINHGVYSDTLSKWIIHGNATDVFLNGKNVSSVAANRVFASPNNSTGEAAFRALVPNDIPPIPIGTKTSGTLGIGRGGTGETNADAAARALGMAKTAGDTINMGGYVATGYLTSSKTKMTLTVATPFRFYGFSGATATATATVRQNNLYLFGSTADTPATLSNLEVVARANGFLTISYTGSTQSSAINNNPVAVYFNTLSITLT